jgi:hypothetical protein
MKNITMINVYIGQNIINENFAFKFALAIGLINIVDNYV